MIALLDIFRVEDQDRLICVSAAGDLETAKAVIKELRTMHKSDYIIYSQQTKNMVCAFIKVTKSRQRHGSQVHHSRHDP